MSALNPGDENLEFDLDLDAARTARREALGRTPGIRLGGQRIELPVELPVDVLEPLSTLNMDVSVLIRQVLDTRKQARESGEQQNEEILGAIINMLVLNPALPRELVDAIKEMARRLMGDDGYAVLAACRPTLTDLGAIAKYLAKQYGVGLGEALPSSDSSEPGGTTSKPTSSGRTKAVTSGRSGSPRRTRTS